jgi:hypothetical protein
VKTRVLYNPEQCRIGDAVFANCIDAMDWSVAFTRSRTVEVPTARAFNPEDVFDTGMGVQVDGASFDGWVFAPALLASDKTGTVIRVWQRQR